MGKKYGLQWLAAMTQVISGEDLIPLANKLIMPLYNLTDLSDMSLMKGRFKQIQAIRSSRPYTDQFYRPERHCPGGLGNDPNQDGSY